MGMVLARNLTDMRCDDAPAYWHAHPGLRLPSVLIVAFEFRACVCAVAAKACDLHMREGALRRAPRAGRTKISNRRVTITALCHADAQNPVILPKKAVERRGIVRGQCLFVGLEHRADFRQHLGQVYLHLSSSPDAVR